MCTILCLLNWNFWWIIMVPHHGGGDMLAQVWSWNENLSTYFTDEIFVVNHLYLLRVTQFSNIRQNEATNNDFHLKHKWQMQMLCNISEEFEGPHGHDTLEKCFLHVNYALKHFLVNTPWRCSWKLTLGKGLVSGESATKCRCCAKVFSCQKSLKVHMVTSGHNLKMHMKAYAG